MALAPKGFTLGFITGFGAGFVTRSLADNPREKLEPILKTVMHAGARLTERSRELAAHVGELLQDTFAEVRAELKTKKRKARPKAARARKAHAANVVNLHQARSERA